MPRWLAVEWDADELRAVLARGDGGRLTIERRGAWPITDAGKGSPAEIGKLLTERTSNWNAARIDTAIVLGRASVELRVVSVPPVSTDELPDIVRMQALRLFAQLGDTWPIDFAPIPSLDAATAPEMVLAATLAPESLAKQVAATTAAGQIAAKAYLRPFTTVALGRALRLDSQPRVWIDRHSSETELIVAVGDKAIYPRSVRLPDDERASASALAGEVRRTLAATANQAKIGKVVEAMLIGDSSDAILAKELGAELEMPVRLVDPMSLVDAESSGQGTPPGRFAALIGACLEATSENPSGLDFLHPRRRPPEPDRRRLYGLIAGAAAAFVLAIVGWNWLALSQLDHEVRGLSARKNKLTGDEKKSAPIRQRADELRRFDAADVNWLDEMSRMAERLPAGDRTVLMDLAGTTTERGAATISFSAYAKESDDIALVEQGLRDEQLRKVQGSGGQFFPAAGAYPWFYREQITLDVSEIAKAKAEAAEQEPAPAPVEESPPEAKPEEAPR